MTLPLRRYFSAAYPAVAISTVEEMRLLRIIARDFKSHEILTISADKRLRQFKVQDNNTEVMDIKGENIDWATALDKYSKEAGKILVVFDFHRFIQDAVNCRRLKAALPTFKQVKPPGAMCVLVAPHWVLPEELRHDIPVLQLPLPSREELKGSWTIANHVKPCVLTPQQETTLLDSAAGLTLAEAEDVFSFSRFAAPTYRDVGMPDTAIVLQEKLRLIKQTGFLEVREPLPMSALGGLGRLKQYVERRVVPAINDEQLRVRGILCCGLSGCLHGDTPILDPVDGTTLTVRQRWLEAKSFSVFALDSDNKPVISKANAPVNYGPELMVEITFEDGQQITVTPAHRFWNGSDYVSSHSISERLRLFGVCHLPSISDNDLLESLLNDQRSMRTDEDFLVDYPKCLRSNDQQPPCESSNDQEFLPLQDDFLAHIHHEYKRDDLDNTGIHSLSESYGPQSMPGYLPQMEKNSLVETGFRFSSRLQKSDAGLSSSVLLPEPVSVLSDTILPHADSAQVSTVTQNSYQEESNQSEFLKAEKLGFEKCQEPSLSEVDLDRKHITQHIFQPHFSGFSSYPSKFPTFGYSNIAEYIKPRKVVQVRLVESSDYFDFHVPVYNNYWAVGSFHHNSGKTRSTQAIAGVLGWPMLSASIPRMKGSRLGESETNVIQVLKTAEAFSPTVLLFDEFEKGVAGYASSAMSDAGTTLGMVGILLDWLSSHRHPILVVASCNNYKSLPPELTNAHRFDECFFCDLPGYTERLEIATVHLQRLNLLKKFAGHVADLTDEWTGAEIEKLIKDTAAYTNRNVTEKAFRETAAEIKTFVSMRGNEVAELRDWGRKSMRLANTDETELLNLAAATKGGKVAIN